MHPRLFDQVEYMKDAGVPSVGISSNATLLNAKNATKIFDSRLDEIILCVDGNTKETYEKIRKTPAFTYEDVCENVRDFLALRKRLGKTTPRTNVQIIVMEETKNELCGFREKWMEAGADEVFFKQYTAWGNQDERFAGLAAFEDRQRLTGTRKHPYLYMWQSVVIHWDGKVVPCCYDYDAQMAMGDLKTQSLHEIWNGARYRTLRSMELDGQNDSPLCRNCSEAPGFERDPTHPSPTDLLERAASD
jgi:radical SAM protein with 4Fe4S-binding SPASM domain